MNIRKVSSIYNLGDYVPETGDIVIEDCNNAYTWDGTNWLLVVNDVFATGLSTENDNTSFIESAITTATDGTNYNVSIKDGNLTTLSLYDLNKQIISQMPALTGEEIKEKINLIREFKNARAAEFYMLLNNEIRYYTVFHLNYDFINVYSFEQEVINCLEDLGTIKSIDLNSDGVIEAWVQLNDNDETIILYLFPYDEGVISCL